MSLAPKPRAARAAYVAPPVETPQALALPEKRVPALNLGQLRIPKQAPDLGLAAPASGLTLPKAAA